MFASGIDPAAAVNQFGGVARNCTGQGQFQYAKAWSIFGANQQRVLRIPSQAGSRCSCSGTTSARHPPLVKSMLINGHLLQILMENTNGGTFGIVQTQVIVNSSF